MELILPWATQMRDSLGFNSFTCGVLQALFIWVVSSERAEPRFAFRKAAIIFLGSKCHCHTLLQGRAGVQCPGTVLTMPWGCADLDSLHVCSTCPSLHLDFFYYFFFQQNRPKRRQARNPEMFLFSAPVRPNDESTCGVCGTCWRNAPGVLELGDLHLVHAHP